MAAEPREGVGGDERLWMGEQHRRDWIYRGKKRRQAIVDFANTF